ncbi:peptidase C14, caspase catalytic subunit p20 [Candidatus Thiomargarita nelsonii]|uniref:Peptidase C14, caspase catalytic subunit p20 n=1 Tax=Candidatus Thiomargarita nelsonii TaxID=1003181 RepID=A0A176S4G8_9GAMM|nr:peptidase C14, caspase catalytic subunit p20 [Candidatus Thiomargarita nelsonii]
MAQALQKYGFTVIHKQDLEQDAMEQAIDDFEQRISKNGISLFYYAGHGLQIKGNNYLIPIKSKIEKQRHVRYRAVNAQEIIDMMTDAGGRVNIVILDACRNNPFRGFSRTTRSGLAAIHAPQGIIVSYATAPGKTADDGPRRNGLYTESLLKAIETPGLPIERVFKETATKVEQASRGRQVPWVSSSLTGKDFCFTPCSSKPTVNVSRLLRMCERHYKAGRLISGQAGNALACYKEVLKKDPMNVKAVAGIEKIEARYVSWIRRALDRGQTDLAKRYLASLRLVNPDSPHIPEFDAPLQPDRDRDRDGVADSQDKCPDNTSAELSQGVDKRGCPLDRDQDGVADYRDSCLGTSAGVSVKQNGCPVPKTTVSKPSSSRYRDNGDGTVTDNRTGLIWMKNASCYGGLRWKEVMQWVAKLEHGQCGLRDGSRAGMWRLPTIDEWKAMVDKRYKNPALSNAAGTGHWEEGDAFSDVPTGRARYCSSSKYSSSSMWYMDINSGNVNKSRYLLDVWAVRDGH